MENPENEIPSIIHNLTQTPPSVQRQTIETYFTPDASFLHPFCRTGSFFGSRWLIWMIYRWYKIMSPHIELTVTSVAYDSKNLILYVSISQVFAIWFIPFFRAPVSLTTVLQLTHDPSTEKYYITKQNDLYQVDQFLRFVPGGWLFAFVWQFVATGFSVLGALLLWPVSYVEENLMLKQEGGTVRHVGIDESLELKER
ncbi:MAG: hypothetical protein M1812_003247 [Candelaria pacifica]|nr:MAG: hypothetical protein M1812_003247 [Candelaria pacifica]